MIDGLALPAFAGLRVRLPQPWIALVHHPLALETGLAADQAETLARIERSAAAARHARDRDQPAYGRRSRRLSVSPARIGVVLPGTDPAPLARGSGGPGLALLCVASLTPRKGHLVLLEALAAARGSGLASHLRRQPRARPAGRAGDRRGDRAPGPRRPGRAGRRAGRGRRCQPLYDRADLFVLASYHEGYGMVLAEALARGLPIVATKRRRDPRHGAAERRHAGARRAIPRPWPAALRQVMTEPSLRDAARRRRGEPSASACRAGPMPCAASRPSSIGRGALSGFAPDWLALREPYDHAARSAALADRFAAAVGATPHLIDLGCGTGANLRYLAPRIAGRAALAVHRPRRRAAGGRTGSTPGLGRSRGLAGPERRQRPRHRPARRRDRGRASRSAISPGRSARRGCHGLSASALLDLTSAAWLR